MQRVSCLNFIKSVLLLLTFSFFPLLLSPCSAAARSEVRSIATRSGVTMDFLVMTPDKIERRDAVIFFPGGNGLGSYKFVEDGVFRGWSFLVRSAELFTNSGLSVFTVAPPSDHSTGMSTGFRESPEHAEDITVFINYLASLGYERVYLVGNSRGTLSVASLATFINNKHLKGVVLTSSLEYENFFRWLPLNKVRLPVLMVHHQEDACRVSSLEEAKVTEAILAETTTVDFVEITGGAEPRSAPCDNLSPHGFFGVEDKAVQAIIAWIAARKQAE